MPISAEEVRERESSSLPTIVRDSLLHCADYSVAALTRLVLSTHWHTGWEDPLWKDVFETRAGHVEESEPYALPETEEHLVHLLCDRVQETEQIIRGSFLSTLQEERRILHSSFSTGDSGKVTLPWSHAFMFMKVFDLALLPRRFARDKGVDLRCKPSPFLSMMSARGTIAPLVESYCRWPNTLRSFILARSEMVQTDASEQSTSNPDLSTGATHPEKRKEVLCALMKATNDTSLRAKLKYVENNFLCAALGLLGCTLPPVKGRTLADRLVEISGVENLAVRKLTDVELLRPLYIAACVSPICFLKGAQISTGHVRVPLYECIESVRFPSLKNDNRRYELEARLAKLIVSIACEGHSAYETGIASIVTDFSTRLFNDQIYVDGYQVECQQFPSQKIQELRPLNHRVCQTLIRIARCKKDESPVVFSEGWVKQIFSDETKGETENRRLSESPCTEESVTIAADAGELWPTMTTDRAEDCEDVEDNGEFEDDDSSAGTLVNDKYEDTLMDAIDGTATSQQLKDIALGKRKGIDSEDQPGDCIRIRRKKVKQRDKTALKQKSEQKQAAKATAKQSLRPVLCKYSQMEPQNNRDLLDSKKTNVLIYVPTDEELNNLRKFEPMQLYEPKSFTLNKWKSMTTELAELNRVIRRTLAPSDIGFGTYVLEYTFEVWETLPAEIRRDLFTQSSIVVHGAAVGGVCGITSWESRGIEELFDVDDIRECQDQSVRIKSHPGERMCQSSIAQFVKGIGTKRVNLFLDIPIPAGTVTLPIHEFNDGAYYMYRENREFCWNTPLSSLPSLWALLGTESATSTCHIDAAGFATYVECLIGEKLWFIAVGDWYNALDGKTGWNINKMSFQCVHLKPGSRLYMRPGQPHFVLTLTDCLAIGGHFYSSTNYSATLRGLVTEHYVGKLTSNTEHPTSPLLLFKLLDAHSESWRKRKEERLRWRFPNCKELASLLIIAEYMDELYPEVPEDKHVVQWQATKEFQYDYGQAQKIIKDFWKQLSGSELETIEDELKRQVHEFEVFLSTLDARITRRKRNLIIKRRKVCEEY